MYRARVSPRTRREAEASRLSSLLVQVAEQVKLEFASIVEGEGLTVGLARAVLLLDTPAPMRDLAERLVCDRSYITSVADQLEDRGLVERVPGRDRRVRLLQLTDEGRALRDRMAGAVSARNRLLHRLDDDELGALGPILTKLGSGGTAAGCSPDQS
jgi:DNA-binding MarR family transcriptional regulator